MLALARQRRMSLPLAELIVGSKLGRPSKMPGRSWGLSASLCSTGNELEHLEHAICNKKRCYAKRGHYKCPSVTNAHERRLEGLSDPRWSEAMAYQINVLDVTWFRWMDAGDVQSVDHLAMIDDVCRRTKRTNHWLPTHEVGRVGTFLNDSKKASNLCIRISAPYIEDRPFETHGLPTSTVHLHYGEPVPAASGLRKDSIECKAYQRDNKCLTCRACWSSKVNNVSYPEERIGRKYLAVV